MHFSDGNILDYTTNREINRFELWEELENLPDLLLACQLVTQVLSLKQELAILGDHRSVHVASVDFCNLVED